MTARRNEPETDADKFRNKSPMHAALLDCEERCLMARSVIEEAVPVLENLYDYCKRDIPEAKAMHALSVLNNLRTAVRDLLAGKESST